MWTEKDGVKSKVKDKYMIPELFQKEMRLKSFYGGGGGEDLEP